MHGTCFCGQACAWAMLSCCSSDRDHQRRRSRGSVHESGGAQFLYEQSYKGQCTVAWRCELQVLRADADVDRLALGHVEQHRVEGDAATGGFDNARIPTDGNRAQQLVARGADVIT